MCGIFATTDVPAWADVLGDVRTMLKARGPDEQTSGDPDPALHFEHTRLAIIGLGEQGRQPTTSTDGTVTLICNGEIYNYRDLAASMPASVRGSDVRVLAEILAQRDWNALADLRGMWAFVAWDRTTQTLSAMRDPFGIKPLYLLRHPSGALTLCSSLPPLLLSPDAKAIDDVGLGHYLALGHTGPMFTMFSAIRKLAPGRFYSWRRTSTGWQQSVRTVVRDSSGPPMAIAPAVKDSVAAHLVSDVEVGAFLSGGVDSTLISAVANELSPGLRTFTLAFPENAGLDESGIAARNAELMRTRHVTIPVTHAQMVDCAEPFVRAHGEPFGDAAALPLTYLAKRAAEDVKVVLCGEGADELFGGYARYRVSRGVRRVRWLTANGKLTAPLARSWGVRRSGSRHGRALEAALWSGGVRGHAALLDGDVSLLLRVRPDVHQQVLALLDTDWAAAAGAGEADRALAFDRSRWLPNMYLEKTDRATMASGLEARVPFLDDVLATAAYAIGPPTDERKTPLREMLSATLPGVQVPARKHGLSVDVTRIVGGLRGSLDFELSDSSSLLYRWLGRVGTDAVAARCRRSPTLAFRVAMLGAWESAFAGERFTCS